MAVKMTSEPALASPKAAGGGGEPRHLMLSYCWAQQPIILKIRKALGDRGYRIWIDGEWAIGSLAAARTIPTPSDVCSTRVPCSRSDAGLHRRGDGRRPGRRLLRLLWDFQGV